MKTFDQYLGYFGHLTQAEQGSVQKVQEKLRDLENLIWIGTAGGKRDAKEAAKEIAKAVDKLEDTAKAELSLPNEDKTNPQTVLSHIQFAIQAITDGLWTQLFQYRAAPIRAAADLIPAEYSAYRKEVEKELAVALANGIHFEKRKRAMDEAKLALIRLKAHQEALLQEEQNIAHTKLAIASLLTVVEQEQEILREACAEYNRQIPLYQKQVDDILGFNDTRQTAVMKGGYKTPYLTSAARIPLDETVVDAVSKLKQLAPPSEIEVESIRKEAASPDISLPMLQNRVTFLRGIQSAQQKERSGIEAQKAALAEKFAPLKDKSEEAAKRHHALFEGIKAEEEARIASVEKEFQELNTDVGKYDKKLPSLILSYCGPEICFGLDLVSRIISGTRLPKGFSEELGKIRAEVSAFENIKEPERFLKSLFTKMAMMKSLLSMYQSIVDSKTLTRIIDLIGKIVQKVQSTTQNLTGASETALKQAEALKQTKIQEAQQNIMLAKQGIFATSKTEPAPAETNLTVIPGI